MYDNLMFNTYDQAIEKLEICTVISVIDYNRIKGLVYRGTEHPYTVSHLRPDIDEVVAFIRSCLPEARYGFSHFPEGVEIKEKGKPDRKIYNYAWVRYTINRNKFVDWTIGHTNIGCALMLALLHCLRDLEKQNAV